MTDSQALAARLARLSAQEMVAALGAREAPRLLRSALALAFHAASRKLGSTLAELDGAVDSQGLPDAAQRALDRFGVALRVMSAPPAQGPLLVLANHPGAYDALGLMSAIRRRDLRILAMDRVFLRALPGVSRHLLFVGDSAQARAGALKRAFRHLKDGGALLHFPAGQIEPDADFVEGPSSLLGDWQPGVAALVEATARTKGTVWVAGVRGVHSVRAKGWALNRWAERRGVTTLSPLLQMVMGLEDVSLRICCREVAPAPSSEVALRTALETAIGLAGPALR